jgi:hypothetical protein
MFLYVIFMVKNCYNSLSCLRPYHVLPLTSFVDAIELNLVLPVRKYDVL